MLASKRCAITKILTSSLFIILLTLPFITNVNASNDNSIDSEYLIRKAIRKYVIYMNKKSTEDIISLFDKEGQFIDENFNQGFSGIKELTNFYNSIFSLNNRLTFTVFPWKIEIEDSNAFVTCSWSLVSDHGVYNGVYWISMNKVANEWKITKIAALITVVHHYNPPYSLVH
jgi:hypothetical protein